MAELGSGCLLCHFQRLRHKWAKCQKPARNGNKNFGKLTVLTYACNNLTNLEYEVHPFTGNGNEESGFEKTVKSQCIKLNSEVNLFLAGFMHLVPLCEAAELEAGLSGSK